jgi:hypothetical protein
MKKGFWFVDQEDSRVSADDFSDDPCESFYAVTYQLTHVFLNIELRVDLCGSKALVLV